MNEMNREKESGVELRIQDLLMAYLRQWRLIALCVVVACTIAWGYTFFCITPMYQASSTIYIGNTTDTSDKGGLTSSDLTASIHLVKGYMIVTESDTVLREVANRLDNQYTPTQLRSAISTSQVGDTVIFAIKVSHKDPNEAMRIANMAAKVVAEMGPDVLKGSSASQIDDAQLPSSPYSPSYSSNIMTGAVAGLMLALVYVTVVFLKDTRIKDENDLTDMFDLPILGRIPNFDDHVTGARYVDSEEDKGGAEA